MNIQRRFQSYYRSIEALISCPPGGENELLRDNLHLLDAGFLVAVEQMAAHLEGHNNPEMAAWLRSLPPLLVGKIGLNPIDDPTAAYLQRAYPREWAIANCNAAVGWERRGGAANTGRAIDHYRRALLTLEPGSRARAKVYNNLGNLHQRLGGRANIDRSIYYYRQALPRVKGEAVPPLLHYNIANAYLLRGDADDLKWAINYYHQALSRLKSETSPEEWASVQHNLGKAYQLKGNPDLAIEYYRRALEVRREDNHPRERAITLENLARAERESAIA